MSSGSFKNIVYKMCLEIVSDKYVWKGFGIEWPKMVDMPQNQTNRIIMFPFDLIPLRKVWSSFSSQVMG